MLWGRPAIEATLSTSGRSSSGKATPSASGQELSYRLCFLCISILPLFIVDCTIVESTILVMTHMQYMNCITLSMTHSSCGNQKHHPLVGLSSESGQKHQPVLKIENKKHVEVRKSTSSNIRVNPALGRCTMNKMSHKPKAQFQFTN